jgi:hypothetical protein
MQSFEEGSVKKGSAQPTGEKQSSGKVQHGRTTGMNVAGKGENLNNFPKPLSGTKK